MAITHTFSSIRVGDKVTFTVDIYEEGWLQSGEVVDTGASVYSTDEAGISVSARTGRIEPQEQCLRLRHSRAGQSIPTFTAAEDESQGCEQGNLHPCQERGDNSRCSISNSRNQPTTSRQPQRLSSKHSKSWSCRPYRSPPDKQAQWHNQRMTSLDTYVRESQASFKSGERTFREEANRFNDTMQGVNKQLGVLEASDAKHDAQLATPFLNTPRHRTAFEKS